MQSALVLITVSKPEQHESSGIVFSLSSLSRKGAQSTISYLKPSQSDAGDIDIEAENNLVIIKNLKKMQTIINLLVISVDGGEKN